LEDAVIADNLERSSQLARDVLAKLQGQDLPEGEVDDLPEEERAQRAKRADVVESGEMSTTEKERTIMKMTMSDETEKLPREELHLIEAEPNAEKRRASFASASRLNSRQSLRQNSIAVDWNDGSLALE
jgi:hypothetical protein